MIDNNYPIQRVEYNWFVNGKDDIEYQHYEEGQNCKQIHYHACHGQHFCSVVLHNGADVLVYNLNRVFRERP